MENQSNAMETEPIMHNHIDVREVVVTSLTVHSLNEYVVMHNFVESFFIYFILKITV